MHPKFTPKDMQRFWSRVDISPHPHGCYIWRGAVNANGYGVIKMQGRKTLAHRIAWEDANSTLLGDLCGCHQCDNPGCVNPAHIFPATQLDNIADMDRKGRRGKPYPRLKLSIEKADEIRAKLLAGATPRELACEYGVVPETIQRIKRGTRWKHS